MTTHTIPTTTRSTDPDNYEFGHFKSAAILRIAGSSRAGGPGGWGIGGWNEDGEGRLVFEGPMVKGPVAYAFGLAGVIDNHGGTGAEHARAADNGLLFDVSEGDTLVIDGTEYTLTLNRRGYPSLTAK